MNLRLTIISNLARLSTAMRFLKTFCAAVAVALAVSVCTAAEPPQFTDVFIAGKDPVPSIRIPSVVVTKSGMVLAFAEGRTVAADQAKNQILLKRSPDGGKTWGALQIIASDGANSLNNPTAVVEQSSGRVWLIYQRIPGHLTERSREIATGCEGTNVYRNFLIWSDNDGATWSPPRDVTCSTKRPTGATTIASGPGIGIQLAHGPHAGRIIFPFNEGPYWQWNNFAVFSDDRGATWQYGENVPSAIITDAKGKARSQVNEVQMVELTDGSVRLNSRQFAGAKVRKTAVSRDGGATWSPVEDVPALRDPGCMASIFRAKNQDGHGILIYSGPDSLKRENGTVHLSRDDGQTWPVKKVLFPGSFAYSVLTQLPDGEIGCLFEADHASRIVFARFPLTWIERDGEK